MIRAAHTRACACACVLGGLRGHGGERQVRTYTVVFFTLTCSHQDWEGIGSTRTSTAFNWLLRPQLSASLKARHAEPVLRSVREERVLELGLVRWVHRQVCFCAGTLCELSHRTQKPQYGAC